MKLNVILAKTDALASSFRACINDYYGFFTNRQGEFKGEIGRRSGRDTRNFNNFMLYRVY